MMPGLGEWLTGGRSGPPIGTGLYRTGFDGSPGRRGGGGKSIHNTSAGMSGPGLWWLVSEHRASQQQRRRSHEACPVPRDTVGQNNFPQDRGLGIRGQLG